eukprot:CAMPEP_0172685098 /NCGR_PEP_ID=MMETSP1074-20121228/20011_1 /TAXON_ID=2916 /ORGANISM="Ceratium fusus, Strain PA161109" /LENGTH=80 /DNA_ID=CAMNT_0013504191 /DNA_START=21 /DNA_END=264 /DNA_ORIENTATION=+
MGLGLRRGTDHELIRRKSHHYILETVIEHTQNREEDAVSKSTTPSTTATSTGAVAHDDDPVPDSSAEDALAPAHEKPIDN